MGRGETEAQERIEERIENQDVAGSEAQGGRERRRHQERFGDNPPNGPYCRTVKITHPALVRPYP